MRHGDDDLSPFREDPVVKALSAPGSSAELAGEADAVAAYRDAVAAPVPTQHRRSAARIATGGTVAVLVLGLSGGVAAAYTNSLPASWQKTVYKQFHSIGVPSPKPAKPAPPVALHPAPPTPVPLQSSAPTPAHTGSSSTPPTSPSPSATSVTASPEPTASVPVVVPTPPVSTSPTTSPTPTSAQPPSPPVNRGQLQIQVSGSRVSAGAALTVTGTLTDPDGNAIANRHVVLIEHIVGEPGRHRVGSGTTSPAGEVTIESPPAQRNMRLVLRSGRIHSSAQRVVVMPILHVEVPATPAGATAVTIAVSVSGGLPGDVVVIRGHGDRPGQRATLNSSLQATFTLAVSQSSQLHYRAVIKRTRSHAAHSLTFYVPPSGG